MSKLADIFFDLSNSFLSYGALSVSEYLGSQSNYYP